MCSGFNHIQCDCTCACSVVCFRTCVDQVQRHSRQTHTNNIHSTDTSHFHVVSLMTHANLLIAFWRSVFQAVFVMSRSLPSHHSRLSSLLLSRTFMEGHSRNCTCTCLAKRLARASPFIVDYDFAARWLCPGEGASRSCPPSPLLPFFLKYVLYTSSSALFLAFFLDSR